jgi:hypothetical protein
MGSGCVIGPSEMGSACVVGPSAGGSSATRFFAVALFGSKATMIPAATKQLLVPLPTDQIGNAGLSDSCHAVKYMRAACVQYLIIPYCLEDNKNSSSTHYLWGC